MFWDRLNDQAAMVRSREPGLGHSPLSCSWRWWKPWTKPPNWQKPANWCCFFGPDRLVFEEVCQAWAAKRWRWRSTTEPSQKRIKHHGVPWVRCGTFHMGMGHDRCSDLKFCLCSIWLFWLSCVLSCGTPCVLHCSAIDQFWPIPRRMRQALPVSLRHSDRTGPSDHHLASERSQVPRLFSHQNHSSIYSSTYGYLWILLYVHTLHHHSVCSILGFGPHFWTCKVQHLQTARSIRSHTVRHAESPESPEPPLDRGDVVAPS